MDHYSDQPLCGSLVNSSRSTCLFINIKQHIIQYICKWSSDMFISCISLHRFNELTGLPFHIWQTYREHSAQINAINTQIYTLDIFKNNQVHNNTTDTVYVWVLLSTIKTCVSKAYPRRQICAFLSLLFRGLSATWQRPGGFGQHEGLHTGRRGGATLGTQNPFKHVF